MLKPGVPDIVIARLPLYIRTLNQLLDEGLTFVSSQDLAERLMLNPAQIRKDLSFFGEFGKQGTGYDTIFLLSELRRILHLKEEWPVALIGYGNLGRAIANYGGFVDRGFRITHIFEKDPDKHGQVTQSGIKVVGMSEMQSTLKKDGVQIAMITAPAREAQGITEALLLAGIKAILNYAPITLSVPKGIVVQYIDPAIHLQHMTYYLDR